MATLRRIKHAAAGAAAVVLCAGCASDPPGDAREVTVRDSAGIQIVESRPGAAGRAVLTLSDVPLLEVGGDDAGLIFHDVRAVTGLTRGAFVVADNGSRQLRYFDSTGELIRSVGAEGSGPGEFRFISWLQRLPGDTLAVYDPRAHRVSIIDTAGAYLDGLQYRGSVPTPSGRSLAIMPSSLAGLFGDRSGLATGDVEFLHATTEGWQTVEGVLLRHHFDTGALDTLASLPFVDHYWRPGATRPSVAVFTPQLTWAMVGQSVLVTTGRDYEVRSYTWDGVLQRLSRVMLPLQPVTAAHREARAATGSQPDPMYAAILPAYSELVVAGDSVWAVEFTAPGDEVRTAHVFDPQGALTAMVEMPLSFTLHDVRDGRLLGVHRDEIGVETVRVYGTPVAD